MSQESDIVKVVELDSCQVSFAKKDLNENLANFYKAFVKFSVLLIKARLLLIILT